MHFSSNLALLYAWCFPISSFGHNILPELPKKPRYPLISILVITTWKKSPTRGHLFSVPGVNFVPGSDQRTNWSKGNSTGECG